MTITLDLQPEIEKELLAQAKARGLSLSDLVQEIVAREAHASLEPPPRRSGQELIDACARVQGLLTGEDVNTLFSRSPSSSRRVHFE